MTSVQQFMAKVWNFVSVPELFYHNEGYFLVRFNTVDERNEVMHKGPYSIFSMPLFLRKWTLDFVIKENLLRVMPLWVTFPSLSLHF